MSKRILAIVCVVAVSFCVGAATSMFMQRLKPTEIAKDWIIATPDSNPVAFDMTAMNTDIPPPKSADHAEGRVKFLERDKGIVLGYEVKLPIEPNPVAALPAKYHESYNYGGHKVTGPAQVAYTGNFTFNLLDQDGFSLAKIKGPDERVESGSDNQVKNVIEQTISLSVAHKTKKVAISFEAEKCNFCDSK